MTTGVRAIILVGVIFRVCLFFVFWGGHTDDKTTPLFAFSNIFETPEYSFNSFLEAISLENTGVSPYETGVFHMNPLIYSGLKYFATYGPSPTSPNIMRTVCRTRYFFFLLFIDVMCAICLAYISRKAQRAIGFKALSEYNLSTTLTGLHFLNPYTIGPTLYLCVHNILILTILLPFALALAGFRVSTLLTLSIVCCINPVAFFAVAPVLINLLHHVQYQNLMVRQLAIPNYPIVGCRVLLIMIDVVSSVFLSFALFILSYMMVSDSAGLTFLWFSTAHSTGGAESLIAHLTAAIMTPSMTTSIAHAVLKRLVPVIPPEGIFASLSPSLSSFWYAGALSLSRFKMLYGVFCSLNVVFYGIPIMLFLHSMARQLIRDCRELKVALPINDSLQYAARIQEEKKNKRIKLNSITDDDELLAYGKDVLLRYELDGISIMQYLPSPPHPRANPEGLAALFSSLTTVAFYFFFQTNCTSANFVLGLSLLFVDQQSISESSFSLIFATVSHLLPILFQSLTRAWLSQSWGNPNYAFGIQVTFMILLGLLGGEFIKARVRVVQKSADIITLVRQQKEFKQTWELCKAEAEEQLLKEAMNSEAVRRRILSSGHDRGLDHVTSDEE